MHTRPAIESPTACVALSRGNDYYLFRYEEGSEAELLSTIIEYAGAPDLNFTWLDVLLILHQLKV